jgi:hypothetical protein
MYHEIQVVRLRHRNEYTVEIGVRHEDGRRLWVEYRDRFFDDAHTANEYARKRAEAIGGFIIVSLRLE